MSAQILELNAPASPRAATLPVVDEGAAYSIAHAYVQTEIDRTFEVTSGSKYYSELLGREIWRFIVRCSHGPLDTINIDARTGELFSLTKDEIRLMHEKAIIYEARTKNELPLNQDGYVLGEYARRNASEYLDRNLSMHFSAADPFFVPDTLPLWQVVIIFRLKDIGPFTLGTLDVDAKSGVPIELIEDKLTQIQERARAIVEYHTSAAEV